MMFTFWFIASTLMLLTLGLLLWPLFTRSSPSKTDEPQKARSVYREQYRELEEDRRDGVLNDEQFEEARRELDRRLLDETVPRNDRPAAAGWWHDPRVLASILIVAIPLCSSLLYLTLGTPLAIMHLSTISMAGQTGAESGHMAPGGLDSLAERLRKRLEQNPNDGAGWALLARTYVELGRHAEAVPIYEKATQLVPDDAQLLADYADALGVLHGRKLDGKPEILIQRAIKADPRNIKALMLAGTVAFDRKEYVRAATHWEEARANLPPDADQELIQELTNGIAEAKNLAGTPATTAAAVRLSGRRGSTEQPSPALAISGTVTITPELARKTSPADTLFVFARSVDGPPMPVAILRVSRNDLPFSFRLDDSNSPMPTRKLSEAGPVVIVARLSRSGEAMPKSGDLQGMSRAPVRPGARNVSVLIDTLIP